ncbi:MAG: hypothetical protein A3H44_08125, partial [Gammaproteobacteria bacterium RIFCSPLOWO2_02_FULL_57_10]
KNNEEDVRAVFEQREMPLRWTHLTRVCAGWRPKSESILALAEDLSLGLDSFVFIDDSPLECEQVLAACPGVLAIQLPPENERETFLQHLWLLDARAATREDTARAQMYAEELQRTSAQKATGSYAEFLAALDIRVDMRKLGPDDLSRTAQLSQRTNQFNTTGIRYSEAELASLLQEPDTEVRCISVTDKYGDYGLTGTVFIRRGPDAWNVFGFMLSCRVLGRGVEHRILRQIAQEAAALGVDALHVDFVKLPRNAPALQFLQSLADASTVERKGVTSQQFRLSVNEAEHWQPGVDDSGTTTAEQNNVGSDMPLEDKTLVVTGDAVELAGRTSGYYRHLASTPNSGAAILHALYQGVIQKTGTTTRNAATMTSPGSPTELVLAGFFTELLGQAEIFREDSFHDLGGHSLKAMMLFSRVASRYGVMLDFRDLQIHPTLANLAAKIDSVVSTDGSHMPGPVLEAQPQADSYPVSPGQSRLWMVEHIRAAGPSPLHMHATLTVAGRLNRQALDLALQALLLRHESLRTCFRENAEGTLRQVVVPISEFDASVRWFDSVLDDAELSVRAQEQNELAFDLRSVPLIRIAAAELASGRTALLITMHHIISDGWSTGIFSRELTELYGQYCRGEHSKQSSHLLQAEAIQFRDFAHWQLQWLASEAGMNAKRFWCEHFAEPVEALQLPSAAPRPALMQSAGASVQIDIEAAVWSGFTRRLSASGASAFTGLFAALQLVLARLSGQQNFCIGTAVAGRSHQQLESVIGFFVNILPLRATLKFDDSFDAFMRAVTGEVNACLSHQSMPFDSIVASLDLARDPGRTPLFDVLLVLQNTEVADLRFGEHVAEVHPVASTTSQYDLTLSAFPASDGTLKLLAEYDNVIYSAANIELILRCVARTLQSLTDCQSETLASIPWLHEDDVARVKAFEGRSVDSGSSDDNSLDEQNLLPNIFRRVVAAAHGRISDTDNDWSYAELESEMRRIADLLRGTVSGEKSDPALSRRQMHVGVIGKRSVRSIAAMLGAMEAGAVYIPLDLTNPLERLLLVIDEGAINLLVSTDQEGEVLAAELQQRQPGLRHVCYADAEGKPGQLPLNATRIDSDAIAYMIFTSGSTGKPKGVQISHGAFARMIRQQIPAFDIQSDDVCAQFAALSFDASLSEIFLALATGASLAITPDAARGDIDAFMHWLEANAITVITLPPVFLRALDKRSLGSLRVLVTAGEAAIDADMRHYARSLRVLNAYGPTETSVCATVYRVNEGDAWPFGVPIGRPLPGVLLTVRDAAGARVPVGVTGELYIGGTTLGQGYFGAPELTAQKFMKFASDGRTFDEPENRWYRTGDLVRWREDGLLEFAGRIDGQIKVRGYRIEPGEIEHAARLVDGVTDALALVHPQLGLLLYCVTSLAQDSRDAFRSTIVAALGRTLPRHMVPSDVLLLDAFPLSPAGKIERAALLAMASARETVFVPPTTPVERMLAQIWRRVLKSERVGCHDDFFALGGDSIKALEVINALRALGFTCELKDFFAAPLLTEMSGRLTPWSNARHRSEPLIGNIAPLPVQNWFLRSRDAEAAGHFHIVTELKIPANWSARISENLLSEVMSALIQNHDSLRARFYQRDGHWVQDIQPVLDMDEVLCCYRHSGATATQAEQSAIEALACRPFALATGPLLRCILVQGPDGASESLVLALHHLVADWVSLRVLIADLNALTRSLLSGDGNIERLRPPHMLRDVTEVRAAEEMSSSSSDVYFRAMSTIAELAPDCGIHSELHTLHLQIGASDLSALRESLRRESAAQKIEFRLQDLLLATALRELTELLPTEEVPLLVESHGRDGEQDLARQVAWLTRARLCSLDPRTGPDALTQAHRMLQTDVTTQPDVFACVAAEPFMPRTLPALMSFNYLGEFANSQHADDPFVLTGKVFDNAMAPTSPVDVPLHMECYVVDSVLEVQVAWSPGIFASETMRACWERVRRQFTCS